MELFKFDNIAQIVNRFKTVLKQKKVTFLLKIVNNFSQSFL